MLFNSKNCPHLFYQRYIIGFVYTISSIWVSTLIRYSILWITSEFLMYTGHDINYCGDLPSRASEIKLSLAHLQLSPTLASKIQFSLALQLSFTNSTCLWQRGKHQCGALVQ